MYDAVPMIVHHSIEECLTVLAIIVLDVDLCIVYTIAIVNNCTWVVLNGLH